MKIVIEDGRQNFYQWDKDQRVKLDGVTLNHYVHFGRPDGGAYEVKIYKDGSWFYANVPNIWLQLSGIQKLYIVNGDKQTEHRASLFITPREKPDGYLYTETEILSFVSLDERLRRLEGDPSVGGYATEQWVREGFQPKGNYLESSALPAAIDTALAQAKESGAFDGAPGKPGKNGQDYVLTPEDLTEIAQQAADMVPVPEGGGKAFIVTITESGDKYTADKTPSEIYAAHNSGVPVLASLMAGGGIVTAYLVTATEDAAMFQVPNFMIGEQQTGATVIIAGNDPADRSVTIVETTIPDSGGNVAYDEAQELTDEQKAQARENIGAQPAGNYLTEVPEGYAKTEDIPTDEHIIDLIEENAPDGIAVTGATVGQTVKISAVDENGVPTAWEPVEFPSGGGNKGWTLLYDGTITIEEAVTRITDSLLVPCDGMVDFIGYINWTANANTENYNDNISISVGKAVMGYGRIGDASNAGSSVFQATVTSDRTYWGRANSGFDLEFNVDNMKYGFGVIAKKPDYENVTIDFYAKTYAGTITLQIYGR